MTRPTAPQPPHDIRSLQHLSRKIGHGAKKLCALAAAGDTLYTPREEAKSSGGFRTIAPPKLVLRRVQRAANRRILRALPMARGAHGSIRRRSTLTNAKPHTGRFCVVNLDIAGFFPSVHNSKVYSAFVASGCVPDIARLMTRLTTWRHQLPQGAPTSSGLANAVLTRMDRRFEILCSKHGMHYSRYVDDITISADYDIQRYLNTFHNIIRGEGFRVKPEKTRVRFHDEAQRVTGLTVNETTGVGSEYKRNVRAAIHHAKPLLAKPAWTEDDRKVVARLHGQITHIQRTNPAAARTLLERLQPLLARLQD